MRKKQRRGLAKKKNKKKRSEIFNCHKKLRTNQEQTDLEGVKEAKRVKEKNEEEEKENSIKQYLKLGHEKLLLTCMGVGYTNINKTFV